MEKIAEHYSEALKHTKEPVAAALLVLAYQTTAIEHQLDMFNSLVKDFDHQICMGIREGRKD